MKIPNLDCTGIIYENDKLTLHENFYENDKPTLHWDYLWKWWECIGSYDKDVLTLLWCAYLLTLLK